MGLNNENYIKKILKELQKLDYIKPDEIPNIDLYMDQVTTFMDEHLKASKRYEDDKLLTKTMINNYTKNNLLPPPNRKKYSKEHMLLLIFIYYFKNIVSISDIHHMFGPLTQHFGDEHATFNLEDVYQEVFDLENEQIDALVEDVVKKYYKSKKTFQDKRYEKDREFLNRFAFICMLSFDVYVKKTIIERLIDESMEAEKKSGTVKKETGKKETEKKDSRE